MPVWVYIGILIVAVMLTGDFFAVRAFLTKMVDHRIAMFQTDLMQKHTEEVQNIYKEMRGWRAKRNARRLPHQP